MGNSKKAPSSCPIDSRPRRKLKSRYQEGDKSSEEGGEKARESVLPVTRQGEWVKDGEPSALGSEKNPGDPELEKRKTSQNVK